MPGYAQGGNVRPLQMNPRLHALTQAYAARLAAPPTRWQRVSGFVEHRAFTLVLPLAITAMVLSFVFLVLTAVGIQTVYGLDVASPSGGFSARIVETYNWPGAVETLSWLWLISTALTIVAWIVFALAIMDSWYTFTMLLLCLLIPGTIGTIVLSSVASIDHGIVQPYAKMQDQMNNWVVNTLHVPGEINITDETAFTRDYLRYDAEHEPVYFTIKSTKNTVTVTPRAQ